MLQNYAESLHKGVPAGAFHHKLNACSFRYITDCAAYILLHMQPEVLTLEHLKSLKGTSATKR